MERVPLCRLRGFLCAICTMGLASTVRAQDCPAVADVPSLLRCALTSSEAVTRAEQEVHAATARQDVAARILPSNPALELGGGLRTAESGATELDRSVDLLQTFEIGGQRGARMTAAETEVQLVAASLQAVRAAVINDVLVAAAEVWRVRQTVAFAREQERIADQLVELSEARRRQGLGSALDVDLAQAANVQARRELGSVILAVAAAEGRLATAVGRNVKLAEGAPLPAPFGVQGLDAVEQHALASRREVLAARADVRIARAREDLLRRERVPDVTLSAGLHHEEFSNVIAARVSVPLPLFRRNQGEIAEQLARIAQADTAARQVELQVRIEVHSALEAWKLASEAARRIEPDLEDRLRTDVTALRDAYRSGTISLMVALSSLREAQSARRSIVDVRVENVVTSFQVARAAGYAAAVEGLAP